MKRELISRVRSFVISLVRPSSKITNEVEAFRATMMSSLLLIYIFLTIMTYYWLKTLLPEVEIKLIKSIFSFTVPLFFIFYFLSRTRYTKAVAWSWITLMLSVIFYTAFSVQNEMRTVQILAYIGNVILISSFILSTMSTFLISVTCIASLIIIPHFVSDITVISGSWLVRYMIFLSFLGVLSVYLREYFFRLSRRRALVESTNESKSLFLASMSHEIRTPLMAIIGFSEIMKEKYPDPTEYNLYVDRIHENSKYLLQLINNVIDLSRIDAGQIVVDKQNINLQSEIGSLVNIFTERAQEKRLDLVLKIEPDVPSDLCTDVVKFRQILTNLLDNAIKFTDRGVIKLTINLKKSLGSRYKWLNIEITDQGCGISREDANQIFEFFNRGHSRSAKKKLGAGIGLALSSKLAQALGGDLRLKKSEPGKGSIFSLRIPLEPVNWSVKKVSNEKAQQNLTLEGLKVLVAEDSEDNRAFLNIVLKRSEVDLTMVEDGAKALEKVESDGPYDLILLDLQMPVMDGYEAVRKNSQ